MQDGHIAYIPAAKEGYWRKVGGGSLFISIVVHGVIILAALLWYIQATVVVKEEVDFLPGGGGGGGGGGQQKLAQKRQRAVSQSSPKTRIASSAVSTNAVSLPDVSSSLTNLSSLTSNPLAGGGMGTGSGVGRGSGSGSGVGSGIGSGFGPGSGSGFIALPKLYASRCSPAERAQKMQQNGGNEKCEEAVKKGLVWLKGKQNPDGSWGQTHKAGMTGMALLSYLGHCETPESPEYGETVLKGIMFLVDLGTNQKIDKFAGIFSTKPEDISSTYEHGIATYALGEMYSFAKLGGRPMPGLREAFEKGVEIIITKQNEKGSWAYQPGQGYVVNAANDLSVTGWQFQALKAAKHTNLKIKGLSQATNKVEDYLESVQTKDGGFGVAVRTEHYNQWNLTGAALLGLQTLGGGHSGAVNKGVRWLVSETEKEPLSWNKDCYLYTWYYNTQALFQKGGQPWDMWNKQFQKEVLANQRPDGSYNAEGAGENGAAAASAAGGDAEIYRTTLCTLMLEVYYRYLKVGDREEAGGSGLMPVKTN